MRRTTLLLVSTLLAIPLALAKGPHSYGSRHGQGTNVSTSTEDDRDLTRCDQIKVTFDNEPGLRNEEQLATAGLRSLKVEASHNGGVRVTGSGGSGYAVSACKAAALDSTLRNIHVNLRGNEVSVDGPDDDQWVVYFLVQAPRGATLDLRAHNGEVSVTDLVDGTVTARTENGPLSIKRSTGTIDANAQNGPIDLAGGSGSVKMHAENGPISVKLDGTSWNGSLDASTQNGPVSLKVPSGYRSGVLVESAGHSPVSCRVAGCRKSYSEASASRNKSSSDAEDDDDDDDDDYSRQPRRLELGSGPTVIHISTVNGPVSVKER
jgi:hypothetical protein